MTHATPPRPSADQLAHYRREADKGMTSRGYPAAMRPFMRDIFVVSGFLWDILCRHGVPEATMDDTAFDLGRLCFGRDPWDAFDLVWTKRVGPLLEVMERRQHYADIPLEQDVPEDTTLFTSYLELVRGLCGEEGIFPQPLLWRSHAGEITSVAIAADGGTVLGEALAALRTGTVAEMVFGMDRSAAPGQGLEFADFVTVVWFVGGSFHTAVIDYVPGATEADRVIRAPNWDNRWWNHQMREEDGVLQCLRAALLAETSCNA